MAARREGGAAAQQNAGAPFPNTLPLKFSTWREWHVCSGSLESRFSLDGDWWADCSRNPRVFEPFSHGRLWRQLVVWSGEKGQWGPKSVVVTDSLPPRAENQDQTKRQQWQRSKFSLTRKPFCSLFGLEWKCSFHLCNIHSLSFIFSSFCLFSERILSMFELFI